MKITNQKEYEKALDKRNRLSKNLRKIKKEIRNYENNHNIREGAFKPGVVYTIRIASSILFIICSIYAYNTKELSFLTPTQYWVFCLVIWIFSFSIILNIFRTNNEIIADEEDQARNFDVYH